MYVGLLYNFKGIYMFCFVEIFNSYECEILVENFLVMLCDMVFKFEVEIGYIEMNFFYFINKIVLVFGVQSLMDYDVMFIGDICYGEIVILVKVVVLVISFCLCFKKILEYGVYNQCLYVMVMVCINDFVWIEEIV